MCKTCSYLKYNQDIGKLKPCFAPAVWFVRAPVNGVYKERYFCNKHYYFLKKQLEEHNVSFYASKLKNR